MTRETATFYQAVCEDCSPGSNDNWRGQPGLRESFARIQRASHDCDGAYVREFEAEVVSSLPVETPPVEGDDAGEVEA